MKSKIFSNGLVVKHRKHAIIFENETGIQDNYKFDFTFEPDEFKAFIQYLNDIIPDVWKNFQPKEANSLGSDYYEYYDRLLDNNGYLSIGDNNLKIEAPNLSTGRLYQFNKPKMQSFIYDLIN